MKFEKTRVLTNCAAANCGRIEFQARFDGSQSPSNAGVMKVANRHRESVRRVVWFGNRGKRKKHPHHFLDLMFFGVAVADDRLFDQPRRIFTNFERRSFRGQQGNPAYLSEFQRDFWIVGVEGFFNGAGIRFQSGNHFIQCPTDFQEARGKTRRGRELHYPEFDQVIATSITIAFNYAPASRFTAGIDS